ncbi:uncharacterized protein FIBRA_01836 [Fibroporia radiculosa]|uniref:Pali-domain-containing protein n=1 Tax=Fibroporia radiculosa TaxID=599839 RepID=J4HTY8_9APHY|nr:uncharacterized protein FIBRA_01836 [Fibroporia radiculosa]CCL99812.1 predicted protein [Fibroporia radiculosa]
MGRSLHIPGVFFLFCALVLLCLVSISLPFLPALDIARVRASQSGASFVTDVSVEAVVGLRVMATAAGNVLMSLFRVKGSLFVWSLDRTVRMYCCKLRSPYSISVYNSGGNSSLTIEPPWTRGLAVHPIATGVTLIALLLSCFTHAFFIFLTTLTAFIASLLAFIAFAADIALYAHLKHEMDGLSDIELTTDAEAAFWMTFVSFVLLCLAGFMICLGRRRDRMAGATNYAMPSSKTSLSWRRKRRRFDTA